MDGDWFKEKSETFPGQYLALEVDNVLFHEKSLYQDVLVFQRYAMFFLCDYTYIVVPAFSSKLHLQAFH